MKFAPNTEGVFFDLPEAVYRSAPGVCQSDLKAMHKSPAHYYAKITEPKNEQTAAQLFGTLMHRAALEPERLAESFVVNPEGMNFATKEGKAWKAEQTKDIITQDEFDALRGCRDSVASHPIASEIIRRGKHEVSVFKRHAATGILLKGRLDVLAVDNEGFTTVADIKTTDDASLNGFSRQIAHWGYHRQAAFYMDIIGATFFAFIATEKESPFAVAVYNLDAESIELGRRENEAALLRVAECEKSSIWPAYASDIQEISVPNWLKKNLA
jgi:hypothetical protein